MPVVPLTGLSASLRRNQRLLGFDVGSKTIGLALSDASRLVASPFTTLARGRFQADAATIAAIAVEHEVGGFVIGLPLGLDGAEGPKCQSVRQFAANLQAVIDLPTAFWDERLSTAAVERMLIDDIDMTRRRRKQVIDKLAAAYILQGALDAG